MSETVLYTASTWVLPVLLAITLHEAAHGFVAWKLGDDTAKVMGRVTFNPLKHVDKFGTILLPALLLLMRAPFLFGWAKPVPVDFHRLRNPKRDMVWVAAAGPGTNLALAFVSALLIHIALLTDDPLRGWLIANLANSVLINLVLAVFNLLPLPPLDGGRIAVGLLPRPYALALARVEKYGLFLIIGILFILPMIASQLGMRLNILGWLIGDLVEFLIRGIKTLAGLG
ncbi:MAG: site-2 protease family protein [Alphaproteobacteria bacterium]|jgi:Zn-dependent protease|nr:site-2 protease family protein [Alphaproteobacteria bacterium]MDP7122632.1 site-2 protease family protein [Alphaproteobacteria bacterium]MDP7190278.1 site-2 protease family protein [Alphaproteobacteria bacterium]